MIDEATIRDAGNQVDLLALDAYQHEPFTAFGEVNPDTDLRTLNLSWRESDLPQRERTKHVHRLHPYLGKFVPQLAEIFLRKYRPQSVYDPFAGSGTTAVEANALNIAAFACDISAFNCLIIEAKVASYDLPLLQAEMAATLEAAGRVTAHRDQPQDNGYLLDWYAPEALQTLLTYRTLSGRCRNRNVLQVILSRAARSARLTTHYDLDFPMHPQKDAYYCHKHHRICRPTGDALQFLKRYSKDTLKRLTEFHALRSRAPVVVVHGDARTVDLPPVDMVFTSPPYVGLIDYHEQHRYAYELLDLPRYDHSEIGGAHRQSRAAQTDYRRDIVDSLGRAAKMLVPGGVMVIVVADRYGLYRHMAAELGLREELRLNRHVNRRTGRRALQFFEDILVWRKR